MGDRTIITRTHTSVTEPHVDRKLVVGCTDPKFGALEKSETFYFN
jgi:hypothetical protein